MERAGQLSRRELIVGGALCAALALAGCGTSSPSLSLDGPPSRVAYLTLFDKGAWSGPHAADGSPSLAIIDDIVASRSGEAVPTYARVGNAGTPPIDVPDLGALEVSVLTRLTHAGIRPGMAINTLSPSKKGTPPSAGDLIDQGRRIKQISDAHGGLYHWIFLDHASGLTPAGSSGTDDLQAVIDGLATAGWPRVMINATEFNDRHLDDLPERTWAMARHFEVLGQDDRTTVPQVVASGRGAVTASDEQFVDYVHNNRRGSTALLKLEIPSETQRFAALSRNDQLTLLRLWAEAGAAGDFRIIYPLYTSGYDSAAVGTLTEQRQLMQRYR